MSGSSTAKIAFGLLKKYGILVAQLSRLSTRNPPEKRAHEGFGSPDRVSVCRHHPPSLAAQHKCAWKQ
eukprot:2356217-Rhodomonas_salina.3